MKPRDRRQFAAVSRARTRAERADALRTVLARLGRWRDVALPLDHIWMAPIHVLAEAAINGRVRSDRLVVGLTHGRLILEAGVDWDEKGEGLRELAALFRRVRLEWRDAVLELTFDGRPAPTGTPPAWRQLHLVARGPDGLVLCDARRVVWLDPQGEPLPALHPARGGPIGRFALELLARVLVEFPAAAEHPVRAAVQRDPSPENWLVYGDWLQAQGDPLGDAVARDETDPLNAASPLLAAWLAAPRADLLRFGLEWQRGHLVGARVEDASGPPLVVLTRALLDSPEGALLETLSISSFQVADRLLADIVTARPRPALRHLSLRGQGGLGRRVDALLTACEHLRTLELDAAHLDDASLRHPTLEGLGLGRLTGAASRIIELPALVALDVDVAGGVAALVPILEGTRGFTRLTLRNGRLTPTALAALVPRLGEIERLHLFRCRLADPTPLLALVSAGVELWISEPAAPVPAAFRTAWGAKLHLEAPEPGVLWVD